MFRIRPRFMVVIALTAAALNWVQGTSRIPHPAGMPFRRQLL